MVHVPDVTVLCVEDRDDAETFDRAFAEDRTRRCEFDGDRPRGLVRFGPVLISERTARAILLRALNDEAVPNIVLIDPQLPTDGGAIDELAGLRLMAWIHDEWTTRELALPACIVSASRFTPCLAYSFVRCGAIQVFDKATTWAKQIDAIWQGWDWYVAGHGRWTHAPKVGYHEIALPPSSVELLPYLEADVPVADTAAALGIDANAVHDRRGALVSAINKHVPARLLPDGKTVLTSGRSTSLARIAEAHGHVWVPLACTAIVGSRSVA